MGASGGDQHLKVKPLKLSSISLSIAISLLSKSLVVVTIITMSFSFNLSRAVASSAHLNTGNSSSPILASSTQMSLLSNNENNNEKTYTTTTDHRDHRKLAAAQASGSEQSSAIGEIGDRVIAQQQQPPLEDPMETGGRPKWVDACYKRNAFNETPIGYIYGHPPYHRLSVIEDERRDRGKFLKANNVDSRPPEPSPLGQNRRRKRRSIASFRRQVDPSPAGSENRMSPELLSLHQVDDSSGQLLLSHLAGNSLADDHDPRSQATAAAEQPPGDLLFKRPSARSSASTAAGRIKDSKVDYYVKKTSFSMNAYNKRQLHPSAFKLNRKPLGGGGNRNFHSTIAMLQAAGQWTSGHQQPSNFRATDELPPLDRYTTVMASTAGTTPQPEVTSVISEQTASGKRANLTAEMEAKLNKLVDSVLANDIRISWVISRGLYSVAGFRGKLTKLNQFVDTEIGQLKLELADRSPVNNSTRASEQLRAEIMEKRKWLPKLEDLKQQHTSQQPVDSASGVQTSGSLRNVSHYVQLFSVALEQMVFDQVTKDGGRGLAEFYRETERSTLKVLCDIENLVKLIDLLDKSKRELVAMMRETDLTPQDAPLNKLYYPSDYEPVRIGNRYNNNRENSISSLKSPLLTGEKNRNTSASGEQLPTSGGERKQEPAIYATRDQMPQSQRRLDSPLERFLRDNSIFDDLDKLLSYYATILANIYI